MVRIILIGLGVLFLLVILLACYSALVVASREDEEMERYYLEYMSDQESASLSDKAAAEKAEVSAG